MSTFILKNKDILELSNKYQDLENKDFYIEYLYKLCETDIERAVICKILNKALQNNSVIRIRNYFISQGLAKKTNLTNCKKQQDRIREERKEEIINETIGLFDALKRWFNKF